MVGMSRKYLFIAYWRRNIYKILAKRGLIKRDAKVRKLWRDLKIIPKLISKVVKLKV